MTALAALYTFSSHGLAGRHLLAAFSSLALILVALATLAAVLFLITKK